MIYRFDEIYKCGKGNHGLIKPIHEAEGCGGDPCVYAGEMDCRDSPLIKVIPNTCYQLGNSHKLNYMYGSSFGYCLGHLSSSVL